MTCPKCGAQQADGAQECSACGIVFARWKPREPRAAGPMSEPPPAAAQGIPLGLLFIAAVLLILGGLVWNKHRQAARAAEPSVDDKLNALNNAQVVAQKSQQHLRGGAATLPPGLSDATIRATLERCTYFSDPVLVSLPKTFAKNDYASISARYPALPIALGEQLAEVGPANASDIVTVTLHVPLAIVRSESATDYQLSLGRRRIETITPLDPLDSDARVALKWNLEERAVQDLAPEGKRRAGFATLKRNGALWTAHAWVTGKLQDTSVICD